MRDDPLGRCHTMAEYDVTPIENIRATVHSATNIQAL